MRLYILAAAVGLAFALAGCATRGGIHPDGTLTDPSSLKTDRSLAKVRVSDAAWPKDDWWTGLGDPQLSALITEALHDNPTLAVADARARAAQAAVGVADAARQPTVDAGASVAETRIPTSIPAFGNGHLGAAKYVYGSFKWDLDLWGGQRAAWEAALGQSRAAEVDAQAARIELSTHVARAYVQLSYAYVQQDVAIAEMKRASEARDLTRQRVAAGIDNQMQLKQSDSEVASAQGQKAQADRAINAARSSLSVLLGKGPDRGLDIGRPPRVPTNALTVPSNVPVELMGHRADLVAARWRVEAASKDIQSAKTEFLPNVNIGAMVGLINLGGGNLFQLSNRFYEAAPAISLPIFDGGHRRANLSGKDAQYDLAVAQYNQKLVSAINEIADDYDALNSLKEQVDAQQRALDAANDAWTLSEQRYKSGIGSYLEALSVRQEWLAAEQRMAALHAQQADLNVQLIQALGGGFRPGGCTDQSPAGASDSVCPQPFGPPARQTASLPSPPALRSANRQSR
ncbi:efflux transporter outer membrane subunit [Dyella sp. M7H15-1]|uniref:efflux transporter outer membrane subunit n=1 Tax=Dyella sp. M7H15-1 TaxID=2501295 RepID=UPI0010052064|nr:efflux transporter outer membrane subunit [Dyella sp. M7H15-1]QAU24637.1 efflux transporter outer membrane subunit [Dyella sp. M7H15-1]